MGTLKKYLYILTILLFLMFSCSKEPLTTKQDAFSNLIGNQFNVEYWGFYDFETNEYFNFLKSQEIDSIYLTFTQFNIEYTKVEVRSGQGYYGRKTFNWRFGRNDQVFVSLNQYTDMEVIEVTDSSLILMGEHDIHLQLQTMDIEFKEM